MGSPPHPPRPAFPVPAGGGCSLPCLPREGRAARCTPRGQSKCTSLVTCSDRLHGLSFTPRAQEHAGTSFENNLPPLRPAPTSAAFQHPPQSKAGCSLPHCRRSVHFTSSTEYCGSSTASPMSTECHGSSTTSPGRGPASGSWKDQLSEGRDKPCLQLRKGGTIWSRKKSKAPEAPGGAACRGLSSRERDAGPRDRVLVPVTLPTTLQGLS